MHIIYDSKIETFRLSSRRLILQRLPVHDHCLLRTSKGTNCHMQKQTDVSALAKNPIFTNNNLIFDLPSSHTLQGFVIVSAFLCSLLPIWPLLLKRIDRLGSRMLGSWGSAASTSPPLHFNQLKPIIFPSGSSSSSPEVQREEKLRSAASSLPSKLLRKTLSLPTWNSFKPKNWKEMNIFHNFHPLTQNSVSSGE